MAIYTGECQLYATKFTFAVEAQNEAEAKERLLRAISVETCVSYGALGVSNIRESSSDVTKTMRRVCDNGYNRRYFGWVTRHSA